IFRAWVDEAIMVPGLLPAGINVTNIPHTWAWPGFSTIDPYKEAMADSESLLNYTSTLAEKAGEEGKDWEELLRQAAREKDLKEELGLETDMSGKGKLSVANPNMPAQT